MTSTPRRPRAGSEFQAYLRRAQRQRSPSLRLGCPVSRRTPDIGTRLFVSLRMVQYHLDKVFTKLDIASRTQLSAPCPATTIGQSRVDAGEQAGAQQQILDLVWLPLSISSIRHSATVRFAAGELRDESLQVGVASQPRSAWTVTSASTPCRPSASGELKSWRSPMTRTRRECLRVSDTAPQPKRPPQASACSASARESLESGDNLSPGWGQAWVRREAAGTGQRHRDRLRPSTTRGRSTK